MSIENLSIQSITQWFGSEVFCIKKNDIIKGTVNGVSIGTEGIKSIHVIAKKGSGDYDLMEVFYGRKEAYNEVIKRVKNQILELEDDIKKLEYYRDLEEVS